MVEFCDRIGIMYAGNWWRWRRPSDPDRALHPYTRGLGNSPPCSGPRPCWRGSPGSHSICWRCRWAAASRHAAPRCTSAAARGIPGWPRSGPANKLPVTFMRQQRNNRIFRSIWTRPLAVGMSVMQIAQTDAPIIEVQHLYKDFAVNSNAIKSGKMRALSDITFNLHRGRAWRWWGIRLPARAPSPRSSPRCTSSPTAASSTVAAIWRSSTGHRPAGLSPERADGVAGSVRFIESDHHLPPSPAPAAAQQKVSDKRDLPDMVYGLLEKGGADPAKSDRGQVPAPALRRPAPAVNIARNLAVEAEVVLADEPTSMLDVSIRIGILNLMEQMKNELGVSMLYITHDIATARYVAEDLAVMYVGHMVEWGRWTDPAPPQHPTQLLISAVPDPEKSIHAELEGGRRGDPALDPGIPWLSLCRALPSGHAPAARRACRR